MKRWFILKRASYAISIIILLLCCSLKVSAQEDTSTTDYFSQEILVRSPYVFEGTVTRSYNFWLNGEAAGRYMVQLHKTFKGELGSAYVEVIAGPDTSGIQDTVTHKIIHTMDMSGRDHFLPGQTCLFVCKEVQTSRPLTIRMYTPLIQEITAFQYDLQQSFAGNSAAATACISNTCKSFGTIKSLYRYLRKFDGIHERDIDRKIFEKAGASR